MFEAMQTYREQDKAPHAIMLSLLGTNDGRVVRHRGGIGSAMAVVAMRRTRAKARWKPAEKRGKESVHRPTWSNQLDPGKQRSKHVHVRCLLGTKEQQQACLDQRNEVHFPQQDVKLSRQQAFAIPGPRKGGARRAHMLGEFLLHRGLCHLQRPDTVSTDDHDHHACHMLPARNVECHHCGIQLARSYGVRAR